MQPDSAGRINMEEARSFIRAALQIAQPDRIGDADRIMVAAQTLAFPDVHMVLYAVPPAELGAMPEVCFVLAPTPLGHSRGLSPDFLHLKGQDAGRFMKRIESILRVFASAPVDHTGIGLDS